MNDPAHDMNRATVRRIMAAYAERTGLVSEDGAKRVSPKRYLWTDAFAVCNYLDLYRYSGDEKDRELALRLIDQVHRVLGRFAPEDPREGWLDGANEDHPTRGGLRIGKSLPERAEREPFDERLEWERDGQYFHYLTRWMHALEVTARVLGEPRYLVWALELARAAWRGFVHTDPASGRRVIVWKMSVDLSRPLIPSTGHHDPLDGFVTYTGLQDAARAFGLDDPALDPGEEISGFAELCLGQDWATPDALGIGGMLMAACRYAQHEATAPANEDGRLTDMLEASLRSLEHWSAQRPLQAPAEYRLAFRELGLSIGLKGVPVMHSALASALPSGHTAAALLEGLERYTPVAAGIERFWLQPEHQVGPAWQDHLDINSVMLATSLAPRSCLEVADIAPGARVNEQRSKAK